VQKVQVILILAEQVCHYLLWRPAHNVIILPSLAKMDFGPVVDIKVVRPDLGAAGLYRLEKNGLVVRNKMGPDKRAVNLVLTPMGKSKVQDAPELLQSGFLREYRKLETWEQHMLLSSMQRIAAMMNAEDIDASPILTLGELKQE
jgi:hypothetical protein